MGAAAAGAIVGGAIASLAYGRHPNCGSGYGYGYDYCPPDGGYGDCARSLRSAPRPPSVTSPEAEQRTPIATIASLAPAHETAVETPGIAALPLEIIAFTAKIEPDHGIARTMALRLRFISERRQRQRDCLLYGAEQEDHGPGADTWPCCQMVSMAGQISTTLKRIHCRGECPSRAEMVLILPELRGRSTRIR